MTTLSQRDILMPCLLALIVLAWVTLWLWGQSPYGRFLTHEALHVTLVSHDNVVPLIVAGWIVMIIAMMLPTSWMRLLGGVMSLEKNLPWGHRLRVPVGIVLLCGSLAITLRGSQGSS
jgi:predicted metal-binding membrane protein